MSNRSTNYHTSSSFRSNPNFRMNEKRPANIQLMNTGRSMTAGWWVLWSLMALAYAVWMCVFQYHHQVSVFGDKPVLYFLWTAVSTAFFLLFPFALSRTRYTTYPLTEWFWGGLISSALTFLYTAIFAVLPAEKGGVLFHSLSAIVATHPFLFKLWGILVTATLFLDLVLAFEKFAFRNSASTAALVLAGLGMGATMVALNVTGTTTINLTSPNFWAHAAGLGLCGLFLVVLPMLIFLISNVARFQRGKDIVALVIYLLLVVAAVLVAIFVGCWGIIQSVPLYADFVLLALYIFTPVFDAPVRGHV